MNDELITKGKCKHCHEDGQELEEVIFEGKKENWCDACVLGRELETETTQKKVICNPSPPLAQ